MNPLRYIIKSIKGFPIAVKESTFLRAEITLGIALFFAIIFYQNGQQFDHGQLFDLKLGITLALVEVPLLMFTPILYRIILDESRKHAEAEKIVKDREAHKQDILHILKIGASAGRVDFEENQTKIIHGQWIESTEDYSIVRSHLSDYDNTLKLLDEAMQYSNEKMHWVESTLKDIEKYLDEELAKFSSKTGLIMYDDYRNTSESYCYTPVFKFMIYSELMKDPTGKSESQKFEITKQALNPSLIWGYRGFAFGDEKTLEEFLHFIRALKRHWALVSKFEEFISYLNQLKENKSLEEFEAKRKSIIRELDKGKRNLKGKCELCPES